MALISDIAATYRGPRRVVRRLLDDGPGESRALMFLMLACVVIFIAQWPRLRREAFLDASVPFDARIGGALMAWIFIAPLALYFIALLTFWAGQLFGTRGTSFGARLALFWALLAAAPLWLLFGLVQGMIGPGGAQNVTGLLALLAFVCFWVLGFMETQWGSHA